MLIKLFCWLLVSLNFPKTLMVLLVCLTFIGQAMASTIMSYHMMSMGIKVDQEQSHNMPMMDHSNHNMISDSSEGDDSSSEDCCVKTCSCFTGGCSSLATLMKDSDSNPIIDLSSKIPSYLPLVQSQQPTSLYRPPILS
tara:strand:- start:1921 stop:2337 length:417 start_codon:yes stop_codon:yes gene_type:complete